MNKVKFGDNEIFKTRLIIFYVVIKTKKLRLYPEV
jgi:hypothetical protein